MIASYESNLNGSTDAEVRLVLRTASHFMNRANRGECAAI